MTKAELVDAIATKSGLSKSDAASALDAVVASVVEHVAAGNKVQVPGLGTFDARHRAAREGRNPATGESMQIAATTVPGFKAAAAFKNAVAG